MVGGGRNLSGECFKPHHYQLLLHKERGKTLSRLFSLFFLPFRTLFFRVAPSLFLPVIKMQSIYQEWSSETTAIRIISRGTTLPKNNLYFVALFFFFFERNEARAQQNGSTTKVVELDKSLFCILVTCPIYIFRTFPTFWGRPFETAFPKSINVMRLELGCHQS